MSTWVDATGGYFAQQESSLCVEPDGTFALLAGAAPAGQGHAATFAGLVGHDGPPAAHQTAAHPGLHAQSAPTPTRGRDAEHG